MSDHPGFLLVDDHPLFRQGLAAILAGVYPGVPIREAGCLDLARRSIRESVPDVMILDISLPDGDGLSFAGELAFEHPSIRVYILTMHARSGMIARAKQSGCRGYFLKEGDGSALLEALAADGNSFHLSPDLRHMVSTADDGDDPAVLYAELTRREKEVFRLIARGMGYKEIAWSLGISSRTASVHRYNLFRKLGISSEIDLLRVARDVGLEV